MTQEIEANVDAIPAIEISPLTKKANQSERSISLRLKMV